MTTRPDGSGEEETLMRHRRISAAAALGALLVAMLLLPVQARGQSLADYTSYPLFSTGAVPPNILLLLDNSGSMNTKAYQSAFDPTKTYYGLFDPLECYDYSSNKFIPDPAANPATLGTCTNGTYLWSGNLLNYVSMRRIDIAKWVMMGGTCSVGGRDAQGNCRQLIGQFTFANTCCLDQSQVISDTHANGRMPSSLILTGSNVHFHMMGSIAALKGSFCVDNEGQPPNGSSCDEPGDGHTETQWQIRVDTLQNATGIIQEVGSKARFGLMEFKGAGDGGKVLSDVGSNVTDMITGIEATTPSTWTPLSESLYEGTRYYAQVPPAYANSDYSHSVTNRDPYYFQQPKWTSTSQYVPCCKSFVIIFTDGQPTQDLNVPTALQDYAHTAANHGSSDHCTPGSGCTGGLNSHSNSSSNFHSTLTDHHDNCSAYYGGTTGDSCVSNGSHYLDDIAYFAHTTDLRQATIPVLNISGKDLPGSQTLTIYTFLAFGSGARILQDAAKMGGFEDRNNNNLPDLTEEWDRMNNETGAAGADGIPDTYYESSDADQLHDRLLAAITSILQRSASGTSVSVLATSSTGEGSLYQAFFYPLIYEGLNQITWTGYTQGLFIDAFGNIREDSVADGKLILEQDAIIKTRFDSASGEVKADRYRDRDGDGLADGTCSGTGQLLQCNAENAVPFESVSLREIKAIWEAGKRLALTSATARNILTWVDGNNDGVVASGEVIPFTTANAATLAPYLRSGAAPYTTNNIINFIRGEDVAGLRDRKLTVTDGANSSLAVWKLGDPIHSTPSVVGPPRERYDVIYGDASYTDFYRQYKERRQVAYVGANDGMLHAFNAGFYHRGDDPTSPSETEHGYFTTAPSGNSGSTPLGQELWAFIPHQLLPHLKWLTQTDYTHVYYVDLKPKVTDVKIFTPDADHPNGWGTILIGGFRMGGSCGTCVAGTGAPPMTITADFGSGTQTRTFYSAYFVLDVTNPERDPVLLWSFGSSDLGLTTSYPSVVRVNPNLDAKTASTNAKWYVVLGSGVTGYDGSTSQTGRLFVVDVKAGPKDPNSLASLVTTFMTSDVSSAIGDLVSLDADLDYRADSVYFGNLINNGINSPPWIGKLYRLTTKGCIGAPCSPGTWGGIPRTPTVLLSSFPSGGTTKVGPIVAAPTVTTDDTGKAWVFVGTGRYYGQTDKTSTDPQYLFGVKDPVLVNACTQTTLTNCERNNLLNVTNAVVCLVCSSSTTQVSNISGVSSFSELVDKIQGTSSTAAMDGWFVTLPTAGERSLSSATIIGGTVFFTTFVPSTDICSASGSGYIYALFYKTGTAYKESVIGTQTVGANTNVVRALSLGTGLPSQMAVQIGAQGSGNSGTTSSSGCAGRVTGFIQASTGALNQFCGNPALSSWSRYLSWVNQRL
jgi:type IV pilus assembly protein PilY1